MKHNNLSELIDMLAHNKINWQDLFNQHFFQTLFSHVLNLIMQKEREIYLEQFDDSKNGFYHRNFKIGTIPLTLSIPRTRSSNFYPAIIPKYSRFLPQDYHNLVESLLLSARSLNSLKATLCCLDLPYSDDQIDKLVDSLYQEFKELNSRELSLEKVSCLC